VNESKIYIQMNTLDAAKKRIKWIFDNFETVVISVSGGKDSTVCFELAHSEAVKRCRTIKCMFLDQEAEYQSSIDIVREYMQRPFVEPYWYQVPIRMTNATSYEQDMLHAWEPGAEWVREKDPLAIHEEPSAPGRFYDFVDWFDNRFGEGAAHIVGLRSEESLNRFRAVTAHPAIKNMNWTTKTNSGAVKFYPIYDWSFEDVWTYFGNHGIKYNKIYDYLWSKESSISSMRVSNLIHEKSYKSLATLQEFEHETFERLQKRLNGVHLAGLYAEEKTILNAKELPEAFSSWKDYRDFLLETAPIEEQKKDRFRARFASQADIPKVHRQQCKQIAVNDWEGSIQVDQTDKTEDTMKKWMDIL
jgi:predicted phosphoadenosine phosphosulfate sulfurtransferase